MALKKQQGAATPDSSERLFSSIDGEDVRVCHPDGAIAIVGATPRPLPKKLWRLAVKAGCQSDVTLRPADMPIEAKDEAFTRKQAIKDAMVAALKAEDEDPKFADAFTANDIPSVRWLEKHLGFGLTSDERDVAWGEVQDEMPDADEEEGEEEGEEEEGSQDD